MLESSGVLTQSTPSEVLGHDSSSLLHSAHSTAASRLRALKIIHRLSQDTPTDTQLSDIIKVQSTIRDKALSMADINAMEYAFEKENEDDLITAAKFFSKMKKRFKLPHLPAIALGVLYFKQKRFKEAVKEFSDAIKLQEALPRPLYSIADDTTALYNRALSYFRVGNDTLAILDLEHTLKLDDKHLKVNLQHKSYI